MSCNAIPPSVSITVPRRAVKTWPPVPRTATHPHKTTTVSQLGWLVLLGRTTTGGHRLLAAHTRHSTPTRRSWPGGRNAWGHASGSWRWTAVHISAPSARVNWSPPRMSLATGLGRRAVRTSSPRPRRSPGPSRSTSSKTPGSAAARRAATVGRCRETGHGWTETGSRGRSRQAATALPSLAQWSALSHHCAHVPGAVGNDQDTYVMTAVACHSRGSMPAGCVCHVHTHPRLAS